MIITKPINYGTLCFYTIPINDRRKIILKSVNINYNKESKLVTIEFKKRSGKIIQIKTNYEQFMEWVGRQLPIITHDNLTVNHFFSFYIDLIKKYLQK